ncbi:TPA: AlpA family phage regulatory protein [Vibrio parahaemolyticus]|uniref:helix-turn-helix transcriptional regulator n=1 Tax=Vibrio furnissii TaxID=29494 RepID=UPI0012ADF52E|nr:AlpA family phage regulatory protein [Vibrio furnissii]HCG7081651.1 AlpA family phage regulatory protein [Vibrio parahaemolyticus]HCH0723326.1 AlpA family phage regulatory protein [Vibrio parahaemolyticus]
MNFQRLLHEKELLIIIGVSRSTIDRWIKAGIFPCAIQLSPSRKAWLGDEVKEWIDSRPRVSGAIYELDSTNKQLNEVFKNEE